MTVQTAADDASDAFPERPLAERHRLARLAVAVVWPGFEVTERSDRGIEPIEIVDYDPHWPARFTAWQERLAAVLGLPAAAG